MTAPNLPPPDPAPAHQLSDADMRVLDFLAEHGFDASRIDLLPPEDRPRAMALIRQMQVLDRYPSEQADDSLVDATLARIDRWEASTASLRIDAPGFASRFRLSDFVSIAALILVGLGVLLPIAARVRQQSLSTVCAGNMRSLHDGLGAYARDHGGSLPLSASVLGGLESLFARKPAAQAAAPGRAPGETAPPPEVPSLDPAMAIRPPVLHWTLVQVSDRGITVTRGTQDWTTVNHASHLGLLVSKHYADAHVLRCPACSAGAPCFAYRVPVRGQRFALETPGRTVIVGDANPLIEDLRSGTPLEAPTANSHNHRGEGQNLLFSDGSVDWTTTPVMQSGGDNIWLRGDGRGPGNALRGWPADANDTFLTH